MNADVKGRVDSESKQGVLKVRRREERVLVVHKLPPFLSLCSIMTKLRSNQFL